MKTTAGFLLLAVLATADVASASAAAPSASTSASRTAAGRALAPSNKGPPLAPADLGVDAAARAAVAVTGGQAVEKVRELLGW